MSHRILTFLLLWLCLAGLASAQVLESSRANQYGIPSQIELPEPYATESVSRTTQVVGWPEDTKPRAPQGLKVRKFAGGLKHPRWLYVLPNNDVLVAESNDSNSADRITLLRDKDGNGVAEERHVFLTGLNQPFGMALVGGHFYVANTGSVVRFAYKDGADSLSGPGEKVLQLPAGGYNHHWTRNLMAGKGGDKLFLTVGSSSNVGEHGMEKEERRARVFTINLDGSSEQVYAWGLRNPNGLDFNPVTGELWTAVNERDKLGNSLVPDYITSVEKGGFYGWPYKYFGDNVDPRWADRLPSDLPPAIVPNFATGSHSATMDIEFYNSDALGDRYKNGAFVAQHGSWNRARYIGYKVVFVPFKNGKPTGETVDFLTGFMKDADRDRAYGRPSSVAEDNNGTLLVADDDGNTIWSVQPEEDTSR